MLLHFFLFYTFFCYYFFEFYHSMLCWLGFRIDNLFWFAFYMLSAILEKHPHMVLVLSFTKKYIWFYCLQEIKNEGTKIEKNNIRHFKKKHMVLTLVIFIFFYAFDHQFFLFNLMLQCCVYWDLRLIICSKFFLLSLF